MAATPDPMKARRLGSRLRAALTLLLPVLLWSCGGGGSAGDSVEPLPAGSGVYFTNGVTGSDGGNFYRVDALSGDTAIQPIGDPVDAAVDQCPAIAALDQRPDGMVLAVAQRSAALYEADLRNTLCRPLAPLPEVMRALAVRADGRIFAVSTTNKLHQLDAQGRALSASALRCASAALSCPVTGIDLAPDGTLYAIVSGGAWSRIDTSSAQLTTVKTGVGLSDDFDIDPAGQVRGLAGGELRGIDLAGNRNGPAINVFGGTAFATGIVVGGAAKDRVVNTTPGGGTETLSGTVAASGHLQGAVVFLDLNDNNVLDSNERRTVTDADGRYALAGLSAVDVGRHAVVARVLPSAIDATSGRIAGLDCTLKAAPGRGALISPYSTLVAGLAAGPAATTADAATAQVLTKLRAATLSLTLPAQLDLARDYVVDSGVATPTAHDSRQLRLVATSLAGILSAVASGLNQRQSVFDANGGYPYDTLVALIEAQLTQVANGTIAFTQLDAVQKANLLNNPGSQPNFFIDGNALLNAFISNISLADVLPDIKDFIVNSDAFKSFFASVMVDLTETLADLLLHILF